MTIYTQTCEKIEVDSLRCIPKLIDSGYLDIIIKANAPNPKDFLIHRSFMIKPTM